MTFGSSRRGSGVELLAAPSADNPVKNCPAPGRKRPTTPATEPAICPILPSQPSNVDTTSPMTSKAFAMKSLIFSQKFFGSSTVSTSATSAGGLSSPRRAGLAARLRVEQSPAERSAGSLRSEMQLQRRSELEDELRVVLDLGQVHLCCAELSLLLRGLSLLSCI